MKAESFNYQFEKLFVAPLLSAGFTRRGNNLFFAKGQAELLLLRHRDKWSALCQDTHLTVCVRHTFLSSLDTALPSGLIYEYPFKIAPSRMTPNFFHSDWHYEPFNEIGRWPEDRIEFGKMKVAGNYLNGLRETILDAGMKWLDFLQPSEACRQIRQYGRYDYCEKIWLRDYEKYLRNEQRMA